MHPLTTYAFRMMLFSQCNARATFQRCMMIIFSNFITKIIEVLIDDFTLHDDTFDGCLYHLTLVLNFEKCHFMVDYGVVLRHVVPSKALKADNDKVDMIQSLPCATSVKDAR